MALSLDAFRREVQELLDQGRIKEIEYVMLKIAMEIQDKANMQNLLKQQRQQVTGLSGSPQELE